VNECKPLVTGLKKTFGTLVPRLAARVGDADVLAELAAFKAGAYTRSR
jgi:hypothetical protein